MTSPVCSSEASVSSLTTSSLLKATQLGLGLSHSLPWLQEVRLRYSDTLIVTD